jgi:hypothetical protein
LLAEFSEFSGHGPLTDRHFWPPEFIHGLPQLDDDRPMTSAADPERRRPDAISKHLPFDRLTYYCRRIALIREPYARPTHPLFQCPAEIRAKQQITQKEQDDDNPDRGDEGGILNHKRNPVGQPQGRATQSIRIKHGLR